MAREAHGKTRRPTIADVAKSVGVSVMTVSRAINDKGEIDPGTKARILEAARALDYRPSRHGRGLHKPETVTVGLAVPSITNPFFPEVADAVVETAARQGWHVLLAHTMATVEGECAAVDLLSRQADVYIAYLQFPTAVSKALDALTPFVLLDREGEEREPLPYGTVAIDFEPGIAHAAAQLAATAHTEIAVLELRAEAYAATHSHRTQVFLEAAREHGLTVGPERIEPAENSVDGGAAAMGRLLDRSPDITGVFAFNDLMAVGAIRELKNRGLAVPVDVAVVGCDGLSLGQLIEPPLTTVAIDKRELGAKAVLEAVRLLQGAPGDPADSAPATAATELVVRSSA